VHAGNDVEQGYGQERQPGRSDPPAQRKRQRTAADLFEVDFHARHEQHGSRADHLHYRQERVAVNQSQHVRPDEDSKQDLQYDDWHSPPNGHFGQQRRSDRRSEDDEHRVIVEHHPTFLGESIRAYGL